MSTVETLTAHPKAVSNIGKFTGEYCPECAAPFVWRLNKRYGSIFHGCSRFYETGCKGRKLNPRGPGASPAHVTPDPSAPDEESTEPVIAPHSPAPMPSAHNLTTAGDAMWAIQRDAALREIDARTAETVKLAVHEATRNLKPSEIIFKVGDKVIANADGNAHKLLPEIIRAINAGFVNVYIYGPAGTGKTTLAMSLAKALSLPFASVSCTAGMPESKVIGKGIPNLTTGENVFASTPFVNIYENGGVFLFDEIDAADANMLLVLNSATANGHMDLPDRRDNPCAKRHERTILICAANTRGKGADRQYVGRNQLDAAFLDRFIGATFAMSYDTDMEARYLTNPKALSRVWEIREKVEAMKIQQIVGTRAVVAVAKWLNAGETVDGALARITVSWTADERSKVGLYA